MILRHQQNENEVRKPLATRRQDRGKKNLYNWRYRSRYFDQGVRLGPAFQFRLQWGNPHNREVPTMKISSDKRVKESSSSFYSFRADMNFQIAVALAGLLKVGLYHRPNQINE